MRGLMGGFMMFFSLDVPCCARKILNRHTTEQRNRHQIFDEVSGFYLQPHCLILAWDLLFIPQFLLSSFPCVFMVLLQSGM